MYVEYIIVIIFIGLLSVFSSKTQVIKMFISSPCVHICSKSLCAILNLSIKYNKKKESVYWLT